MTKGIFPQLSVADITNALAGLGITVSHEQLVRPTPDFVEAVFYACLQQVTDINQDVLRDPVLNAITRSSHDDQDIYSATLSSRAMFYHLARFAKAAKVEDFNLQDIGNPERERTLILLSAFINFIQFTEQYCVTFVRTLCDRSDALRIERDNVIAQLNEQEKVLGATKLKIAEDEPQCELLRSENNALRTKLFATKEHQTAALREVDKLKADKAELLQRKESLDGEINTVTNAVDRIRSRIVQSPERIKRTITSMGASVIDDKKTVAMYETKARDLQIKINALLAIEKDVRGCVEQLQTIEKEVNALSASQKELADSKDQLDSKLIERNELRLRRERVERQLSNAHEKLNRARKHAEEKKISSQKTIERLEREYDEMLVDRRENDRQMEELRAEASNIETAMAEHVKANEAELNELLAEYWKLQHDTDVYMETLKNKLNLQVT